MPILCVFFGLFLFCLASQACAAGPVAPTYRTGQTVSYGTGDDGALQKGVAWPNPRFTPNGDGTVTDNLTGLMWMQDADAGNDCHGPDAGGEIWATALASAATCNENKFAGYTDWRLPNLNELHSLIDWGQLNPALPVGHPFTHVTLDAYWSSTSVRTAGASPSAWRMYGSSGYKDAAAKATQFCFVWPVRGGQ